MGQGNRSRRRHRIGVIGALAAAVVLLSTLMVGTAAVTPAGAATGAAPSVPGATAKSAAPRESGLCPGGTAMTFVNDSGLTIYGAITLNAAAIATHITPTTLVNTSVTLAGNYPVDPHDPSGHTHYFCVGNLGPGGSGNFWISVEQPIVGLPSMQPTVTATYRWGEVEFGSTGVGGTTDYTNVNAFSFPLDMQAYATPGGSTAIESSLFSGNTCQIVSAMHAAVDAGGGSAGWSSIERTDGGKFTRIVGPITYNGSVQQAKWPSLDPYIAAFANSLPAVTSGPYTGDRGPFTVEGDYGGAEPAPGWFYYHAYIDELATSDTLMLAGNISQTMPSASTAGNNGTAGGVVTIPDLTAAIYAEAQGPSTFGAYNVAPTPAWWPDYNDVYAVIVNDVESAFNYGYWGSSYGSGPGKGKDNRYFWKDWNPSGNAPTIGEPAYPAKSGFGDAPFSIYAKVLNSYSRNYAFSYNEQYGGGGNGSPLLTLPTNGEYRLTLPPDGFAPGSQTECAGGGGSQGYWEVASDGGIFTFGDAGYHGSQGGHPLSAPIVGMAPTPDGKGYWEVASDGGIFTFGDAGYHGSQGGHPLSAPIVGMAPTPDGKGYWEVASDGGIFTFGDAGYHGSQGGHPLSAPIVGMAPTPDGKGYWEVASDGGIFTFGDAGYHGSQGGHPLSAPIVGMAPTPDGKGYWEVASDGGIFTFGDAGYHGSQGGHPLSAPIVGMAPTPDGKGYWEVASDGGIFTFGDAGYHGSQGGHPLSAPIVGMA